MSVPATEQRHLFMQGSKRVYCCDEARSVEVSSPGSSGASGKVSFLKIRLLVHDKAMFRNVIIVPGVIVMSSESMAVTAESQ